MRFSAGIAADRLLPERLAALARPFAGRLDTILSDSSERGTASRMSIIAFLIRIASAAIAFVSQVLLARWMGSFDYGIFVLVWITMVIVGNMACLGFHTTVVRFIPEYLATGMMPELRGILLTSRLFAFGMAACVAAAGALVIHVFSGSIEPYYIVPFTLGLACLPMIALSDVLEGIARANSWAVAALSPIYITRPVLILVFMAGAMAAGWPARAETAVIAAIAATYVTTLVQLTVVTIRAERRATPGPRRVLFSQWLAVSLPIFLIEGFFFLVTNADVLMVGRFMEPDSVAVYFAAVKTLALVHFVYFAVKAGAAQRYAKFAYGGDRAELAAFARETVSWTFWPSVAMGLAVLAIGRPMLTLFGPGFESGYPLLFLLVAAVVGRASVGPAESLLTMSGNQKICAAVYGLTLALNITLSVLLIPLFGLWGAAMATSGAMIFEAAVLCFIVWRRLGIVMSIFLPAYFRDVI